MEINCTSGNLVKQIELWHGYGSPDASLWAHKGQICRTFLVDAAAGAARASGASAGVRAGAGAKMTAGAAAGAAPLSYIGVRVGLANSAREKIKARAVVEIYRMLLKRGRYCGLHPFDTAHSKY